MDTILKNSKLNKIYAIIAALFVAVTFSLTSVFAQGEVPTGSVTVNNVEEGATVKLYQIATVNWNETTSQPVDPMYKWVESVNNFITANKQKYGSYHDSNGYVTNVFKDTSTADEKAFLEDVFENAGLAVTKTKEVLEGATSVTFGAEEAVEAGLYLIEVVKPGGSQTKLTYQITTAELLPVFNQDNNSWIVNNATVNVKSVPSGSTKEVTSDNKVAVGDTVNYQITTAVPSYPENATNKKFTVKDILGKGLTLSTEDPIQINGNDLTPDVATLSQDPDENSFTLTFVPDYINDNQGKQVVITYSAIVNENAFEEDALGNEAYIGANDPTTGEDYEEGIKEVDVYTYGITVKKVNSKSEVLSGAEFELKIKDSNEPLKFTYSNSNGVYTYAPDEDNPDATTTLITNDAGEIKIQGINTGEYTLTETKAPNGYVLPADPNVTITLVDDTGSEDGSEDGKLDSTSDASGTIVNQTITDTPNDNVLEFGVTNKTKDEAGFELPNTGGMGTLIFTVGGILLMAGAVIFLVVSKKKA